jgi:hypothetical protein
MLCKLALENHGFVYPMIVPLSNNLGPSLSNPTILISKNNEILINLRNLNYVLYHSESGLFEHSWGPLCYLHEENNQRLVTNNILCKLNNNFQIISHNIIDTTFLDEDPIWEFVGLEDGRLVEWGDKLFLSGVRRDTTTNGVGRMELSEIVYKKDKVIEKSRFRIPAPGQDDSYCEKNWMPILDKPYTYIKWTNPTEVVEVDPLTKTCKTIILTEYKSLGINYDLRGGSQVIPFNGYYLAVVHEVDLYKSEAGKKNANYRHRFVVWNKNLELIEASESFGFMGAKIEFCCGLAEFEDKLLITFGFQDNAAYILGMPKTLLGKFLKTYE